MKKIILALWLMSSFAHAEHRANLLGPLYDVDHKPVRTGDRAIGLACISYDKKSHPELIDNPEAVRNYVEQMMVGVNRILVPYILNDNYLADLHAPLRIVPIDPTLEKFVSVHRPSVAARAAEFALGVIMMGTLEPAAEYNLREEYESCVAVEGTYDARSAWQKMKDYFSK